MTDMLNRRPGGTALLGALLGFHRRGKFPTSRLKTVAGGTAAR